jgi:predicted nucleotide-binding protein (sugar kinase/HSP70/actin superfamily)
MRVLYRVRPYEKISGSANLLYEAGWKGARHPSGMENMGSSVKTYIKL